MATDPLAGWGLFVNCLVAAGTIGAVVVAIWGDKIRHRVLRPSLRLVLLSEQGEAIHVAWIDEHGKPQERTDPARYYHLRVSNPDHRWLPVNNVFVYLLQMEERGPDGTFKTVWLGDVPLIFRHSGPMPVQRTIGTHADADLCSVVKDNWLSLSPLLTPNNLPVRWDGPTHMRLTPQARGVEADSNRLVLDISWDGKWHDGAAEMRNHLKISVVSSA